MKRPSKLIATLLAGTAFAGAMMYPSLRSYNKPEETKPAQEHGEDIQKPFSLEQLTEPISIEGFNEPGWCAGYATRAAKELFGLEYHRDHAWNLRYDNAVVQSSENGGIDFDSIAPGSIIGVNYPRSRHNTQGNKNKDKNGNPRAYTHVVLYLGQNQENGNHRILHNFEEGPVIEDLESFLKVSKGTVKEVLMPK